MALPDRAGHHYRAEDAVTYDEVSALVASVPPPPEPFRFTSEQWAAIRPLLTENTDPQLVLHPPIWGVPVYIVDTVEESTPYQQGWIERKEAA